MAATSAAVLLPSVRVTLIITLLIATSVTMQQAISIESDQAQTKSETTTTTNSTTAVNMQAQQQQQTQKMQQVATVSTRKPTSSQTAANRQNGRVRRPTQAIVKSLLAHGHQETVPTTTTSTTMLAQNSDPLQDEIRRVMAEYRNTPPLFVTTTRDFFVDVARYHPGFKLATMQAIDSEGDRIEYSLKPASYRDASPYFAINSSSGELRLANKRIPVNIEVASTSSQYNQDEADGGDGGDENGSEANQGVVRSDDAPTTVVEKPGHLYVLNVAASDGKYTSVVELQIHVFNSTTFGTKAPVQLTIDRSLQGGENVMRAKTIEFFDQLYRPTSQNSPTSIGADNSTKLVFPSYVNPGLIAPSSNNDDLVTTLSPMLSNDLDRPVSAATVNAAQQQQHTPPFIIEPAAHFTEGSRRLDHVDAVIQQPVMLSFVIIICSCFTIALVLLIFVVPLSVKRLKKRLKTMERHHEQLSQKTSNGNSSIVCSSANSTSGSSMTTATSGNHLPSLSQFTLTSSDRSCAGDLQLPHQHHHHRHLARQSSLDSAITSGAITTSYQATQRYHPTHLDLQNQQQHLLSNGLNRINNGAIVNPIYLQNQVGALQQHQQQANELNNNIYCPIEDEFYSTINEHHSAPSGIIVGQTYDSRNYFASQCAPLIQRQQQQQQEAQIAINCHNNQRHNDENQLAALSRSSSRSSTRSLARFLSLPARHSSHQQAALKAENDGSSGVSKKRKISNLDELEYHLSAISSPFNSNQQQQMVKTIARAQHVGQEQQVRQGKRQRQQQQPVEHVWEVERHRLRLIDLLDEGEFGLVWRYKLRIGKIGDVGAHERVVAVKTLKSSGGNSADERERQQLLLAEIEIMKRVCDHPNVVKILHCCTLNVSASNPILLVMEHVELGKLQSFLERSRASHNYATTSATAGSYSLYNHSSEADFCLSDYEADDAESTGLSLDGQQLTQRPHEQLTSRELIKFIYHVAKGMEYVSSHCVVHRDLASRNILISANRVCKIGDFGMARHVADSCDAYERHSRNAKIPVRWMAPEVLLSNSFTIQSDVYSFGILMWEIVTLGSTPYAHLKKEQIIERVARIGERPSKPDYCHSLLYSIMSKCWSRHAHERPTFGELVRQLDQLLLSTDEYIQLDQYPDHNYYNITAAPGELV